MGRDLGVVNIVRQMVGAYDQACLKGQSVWAAVLVSKWFPRRTWAIISTLAFLLGITACRQTVVVSPPTPDPSVAKTGYADTISNVAPCVVSVHTRTELTPEAAAALTNDPALRQMFEGKRGLRPDHHPRALVGLGSGVVISRDGYIVTSGHVIEGADRIVITTSSGEEFRARVIGNDEPTDIAVLKIDATNLPVAKLANSNRLRVGDIVLAIGNPFGVGETVTSGIVSGTERDGFGITDFEDFIQTDASINPGNSGGALVDAQGRVVGISIAILSSGGGFEGIGLAVPINLARNVVGQLISNGKVLRGYLGATLHPLTPKIGQSSHVSVTKGALVSDLAVDSPAAQAGMQQQDIIVEFNGRPVASDHELRMRLAQMTPGTRVQFKVRRSGSTRNFRVVLGEMPPKSTKVAESGSSNGSEDEQEQEQE